MADSKGLFRHTELIGLEKTYNYLSSIKLKRLSEGLIKVGSRDWQKVNPRLIQIHIKRKKNDKA